MEKGQKLPAPKFCNPEDGEGALGNQFRGKMYYKGSESDRKKWVTLVQQMLLGLGYSVGPKKDDGIFGDATESAVKLFQQEHEDWEWNALKVDGLVGPRTSDALNRAMVGVEGWYSNHQTEKSQTITFSLLTTTAEALKEPLSMDVDGVKNGKVVITSPVPARLLQISVILYPEGGSQPLANYGYKLYLADEVVDGTTDQNGLIKHDRVEAGDYMLEIAGSMTFIPAIPNKQASLRWVVFGSKSGGGEAV